MPYRIKTRDEHYDSSGPKRILTLDGGGLRGILSLAFLARIEAVLSQRHGDDGCFRLGHYFDLIAGTSTGAIIAAGLAMGMRVEDIIAQYMTIGETVFRSSWFRHGLLRARFHDGKLSERLQAVLGEDTSLGSDQIQTGLLIMTKRLDTGSPWPLGNNPRGKYFTAPDGADWTSNADFPLWKVVRASTAAPMYFDPEKISIREAPGRKPVVGDFVDGGVSPFNNPALQAFMYATLDGFKVDWPVGADKLLLVSIGTGSPDPGKKASKFAAPGAVKALLSLMDDCSALVETMMQWMSSSTHARTIDDEIGDLRDDLIAPTPLLSYLRYDLALTKTAVNALGLDLSTKKVELLSAMDRPENLAPLRALGERAARQQVQERDFPRHFDLSA